MEEALRKILGDVGGLTVPIDQVAVDDDLFVAGMTSLTTVTVLISIEDEFGVEIPDTLLKRDTFRSIAALTSVIDGLRVSQNA